MTLHRCFEEELAWDMKEPCKECPFRVGVPPARKGIIENLPDIVRALTGDGHIAHSCHRTDSRVTDGGFKQGYTGPMQACAGFTQMMAKSNMWSGPALRAMAKGKLDPAAVKDFRQVHSLKELTKVMSDWAKAELKKLEEHD